MLLVSCCFYTVIKEGLFCFPLGEGQGFSLKQSALKGLLLSTHFKPNWRFFLQNAFLTCFGGSMRVGPVGLVPYEKGWLLF